MVKIYLFIRLSVSCQQNADVLTDNKVTFWRFYVLTYGLLGLNRVYGQYLCSDKAQKTFSKPLAVDFEWVSYGFLVVSRFFGARGCILGRG